VREFLLGDGCSDIVEHTAGAVDHFNVGAIFRDDYLERHAI
jgi:hypothetical protein